MFWLCQAALPHLAPGASIINTSSVEAYQPKPALMDYAASKAAIVNVTKSLATELAEKGIRVNTVAPGPIWTPLIPATMPPEEVEQFSSQTPLGRAGQPAELAPATSSWPRRNRASSTGSASASQEASRYRNADTL